MAGFHCLLVELLHLPEQWAANRDRNGHARILVTVRFRATREIALEVCCLINTNGLLLDWWTIEEGSGSKSDGLRELSVWEQRHMAELHHSLTASVKAQLVNFQGNALDEDGR